MACSTGRCALRRFDNHGSSSYRPTNPAAEREFKSEMERLMAERARQDVTYFPGAGGTADATATADLQSTLQSTLQKTPVKLIPGAGILRQFTPSFSPKTETSADLQKSPAELAGSAEEPTGPCWSLSS